MAGGASSEVHLSQHLPRRFRPPVEHPPARRREVGRIERGEAARAISEEGAYFPTWSPNGHTLLFYEGDALRAAELPGLAPAVVSEAGQLEGKLNPPTWVP